ncbi:MAG TPA: N-acetyltransferase, partial [Rhodospirillales bacterium]|nr:N-acetyltransferase [Rhodospirillales bacterium]
METTMTIEVSLASRTDYDAISAFIDRYWAPRHIYCRSKALFEWAFGPSPDWRQDGYCFALARSAGQVIGILGGTPFTLNRFGAESKSCWLANWMVLPEHRRSGAGLRLMRIFSHDLGFDVFSIGLGKQVVPLYRAMRWRVMENFPRWVLVAPGAGARVRRFLSIRFPDWKEDKLNELAEMLGGVKDLDDPFESVPFDASWDEKGWPGFAPEIIGAKRDCRYLEWRYLKHPHFDYQFIVVPEGDRLGLLVWRKEDIIRRDGGPDEVVERAARIVDFLPSSKENARQLTSALIGEMKNHGLAFADFYGTHDRFGRWMEAAGFRRLDQRPVGKQFPSR